MSEPSFVSIEIEAGVCFEEDVTLTRKAVSAGRSIVRVVYEEGALRGWFRVFAVDGADDPGSPATATLVEDSSDGTALLISGGEQGLLLRHEATGREVREPYLLLSPGVEVDPPG